MSSSSAPSLGVVSVTITLPGPWTVMVHMIARPIDARDDLARVVQAGAVGIELVDCTCSTS